MKVFDIEFIERCEDHLDLAIDDKKQGWSSFINFSIGLSEEQAQALKELFYLIKTGELKVWESKNEVKK